VEGRQRELAFVALVTRAARRCAAVPLAAALLLAALPSLVRGQDGTASGTLTLDEVTVPLTHAYASAQPGFFDKTTEDVRVLLSDVPLTDTALADVFELIHLARDGKAHILEVVIDATGAPISGAIYAKNFDGMVSATGMHRFARERMERTLIAGRLSMESPHTFMKVTWQYDATFSAPIPRPPTAEETAAALASPPAQAAGAYVAAVRRGELRAFLATLAESAAVDYRGADAAARLKQLRADMPGDTRVASVKKQPDGSVVVSVEGHQDGIVIAYPLKMVLDAGSWKVGK